MKNLIARIVASGSLLAATAVPLLAQSAPQPASVLAAPEIDASAGLLAVAAVVAILAFAWERRRRAA